MFILTNEIKPAQIYDKYETPVIYLTSCLDNNLLRHAKLSQSYGYLVKPAQENEIHVAIEMALHRRRLENKSKEKERWLYTTLRSIKDAVIVTDDKRRICFMNPVAEKMTGWKQADAYNLNLGEVYKVISQIRDEFLTENKADRLIEKGSSTKYSTFLIKHDKSEIPIDEATSTILDYKGNMQGKVLVFRDITAELREARIRRMLIHALGERVKELNCLFGISKLVEKPGVSLDEIMQETVNLIPPALQFPEKACARIKLENNIFVQTDNFAETEWIKTVEIIAYDESVGALTICYLEKRNLEKRNLEKRKGNNKGVFTKEENNLIVAIAKKMGKIIEYRQLKKEFLRARKLESVGILAGGIAHDFNNLLSVILGNISMVADDLDDDDNISEMLADAHEASLSAKDLTRQLITFSKGGAPVKTRQPIKKLIQKAVCFSLAGSNVKGKFFIPDDLWQVKIDKSQVKHVINNLIINSIQAMPTKSGTIEIYGKNIILTDDQHKISLEQGEYIKISIKDNGIGILEKDLPKIFDPYFSTKERGVKKGMGLGLATSYSIIKKHDGDISVESEPGMGASFHIYLPKSEHIIQKPIKEKCRILLMDDEKMIRRMIGHMLKSMGHDYDSVENGEQAIELYEKAMQSDQPYDIVILDLTIREGMGGLKSIEKLIEIDPEVNGVVSSGYAEDPAVTHYKRYGFSGVLPKPASKSQLIQLLETALAKKESRICRQAQRP
ncbi:ATP-binding protein [Desulfobacterales bacterium HSG16]|nr:ATP-binding protein [Desulfobacterales bacterium HSG16]